MSLPRIFQLALMLVLWYFFAGLVFTRVLGVWPRGFEVEGYFIIGAAMPWSMLALGFYNPTDNMFGAVARDLLFFGVLAAGIAVNAVLFGGIIRQLVRSLGTRRTMRAVDARARVVAERRRR